MAETKARFLANLIGADNTANDFTLPNTAVSGTNNKVLTSGGDGTVTWETTVASPTFSSMSGTVNEDDQTTLTINGGNFAAGMTIDVYNNSDTKLNTTSLSSNLVNVSQITVDIPNNTSTNGFPIASGTVIYLKIIKSGLTVNTSNITVNADPVWGSISNPYTNSANGATGNIGSALTAPTISSGSGTITYSIVTQPSDGVNKYSINSSRQISVDSTSNSSAGNLASSGNPKTDAISVRATGPAGATQASDLAVNIAVYQYALSAAGTVTTYSNYRVHSFLQDQTSSATTFNLTVYNTITADILIVAGGGGGAGYSGGGGGAGGVRALSQQTLNAGNYTITVGAGGSGSTHNNSAQTATGGSNGGNSSVVQTSGTGSYSQTATGGGVGGSFVPSGNTGQAPGNGGSGGGGGPLWGSSGNVNGGTGDAGNHTPDEGNDGGDGQHVSGASVAGGGGGGAGGDGGDGSGTTGGQGGIGIYNYWRDGNTSGTTLGTHKFGGGGIGDGNGSPPSNLGWGGGSGGGANGSAHTGGGGGGNTYVGNNTGGTGGSGIVVIRYVP